MQEKIPIFSVKNGTVEFVDPVEKAVAEWQAILKKRNL